tara:strand:+ start:2665 stop:3141 length:477 start_codon:yes stop_codon:yes gene_type:complete
MKIELKNLKYAAFASEETFCFNASVYIDGKKEGTAENEGRGGCCGIHPFALVEKLNAYAKTLEPITSDMGGKPFTYQPDADSVITGLVSDALTAKDLKKALRNRILFARSGEVRQTRTITKAQLTHELANPEIKAKFKADEILNLMPFDAALKIFTAA